jgi:hypothetical protein
VVADDVVDFHSRDGAYELPVASRKNAVLSG